MAVIGLGLIGQLTVQLLKAAGCRVLGFDLMPYRAELAAKLGCDAACVDAAGFRDLCRQRTGSQGADVVLITAETSSSEPVNLAAEVARDRGVVVAVGTVGLEINRKYYYEKELEFRCSRSYGPGRYDTAYEQKGRDYPIGYVRWTETRNMESFLQLLSDGSLNLQPLITHRFSIDRASLAYHVIDGNHGEPFLGVIINYPDQGPRPLLRLTLVEEPQVRARSDVRVGLLGAGNFAMSTLLPAMKRVPGLKFMGVCSATGPHARHAAEKFGFNFCTANEVQILQDEQINTVAILTRHNLHALQVISALGAGKHVFCEKPLCLTEADLLEIVRAYCHGGSRSLLMVGFNRRFAPMAVRLKSFLAGVSEPLALHYRINAGYLAPDHWLNDPEQGGGRILGEVCHFVDFLTFLAGSSPLEVQSNRLTDRRSADNIVVSLRFANGSLATISYLACGDRSYSKERLEVFGGESVAVLDDFRRLDLVRRGRRRTLRSPLRQDKGHRGEWEAFSKAIREGGESPIPFDQILTTTFTTLRIAESVVSQQPQRVDLDPLISAALKRRQAE